MDSSYPYQLILSAIFMLLISHTNAQSKTVEEICRETTDRSPSIKLEDCVNALQIDPTTTTANLTILAQITMQLAISNATDTQTFIKTMADSTTIPETWREPLRSCLSWYEGVVMSFESAVAELDEDILSASYDVRIAGDDARACEHELADEKAQIPCLSTRNYYAILYSSIASVITDEL